MDITLYLGIAAVIVLVVANGLFVATEFSYVAVRRTRIEQLAENGHTRARLLLTALKQLDKYIAATQLGITMSSLALGWIGEPVIAGLLEAPLHNALGTGLGEAASHTIAVIIAFVVITGLHIVFGELAPKTIALQKSEETALWVAAPIAVFTRVFGPFIWALNGLGRLAVRAIGIKSITETENNIMEPEELERVIEASANAGQLSTAELLLARRGLEFGEIQADQIMTPRTEIVALNTAMNLEEVHQIVDLNPHARYPVYEGDLDHMMGLLDTKDLLSLKNNSWLSRIGSLVAIPEATSVEVAVTELQTQKAHMAMLIDEHGGTTGILTESDVLWRLLGRSNQSEEIAKPPIRPLQGGNFLLEGTLLIDDLEDELQIKIDTEGEEYDTTGGLAMARLGRIPKAGDLFVENNYEFRVMAMDGKRVSRLLVSKIKQFKQDTKT